MPVAYERSREGDHAPRDTAMSEKVPGENKERNRHDLELLDAREKFEGHHVDLDISHCKDEDQYGKAECDRDRHSRHHHRDEQREDDDDAWSGRDEKQSKFVGETYARQQNRQADDEPTRRAGPAAELG